MTGFQTKRAMAQGHIDNFVVLDTTKVDSQTWYTVRCTKEVGEWLRQTYKDRQDDLWYEHIDKTWYFHRNKFDIHEKIYFLLSLKWPTHEI